MIPKLTNINEIKRLATHTDILKINRALSVPSEQYLGAISQGEKTPQYYKTARHNLHTRTHAPTQIPKVPQPMGSKAASNPQPISQPVSYNYDTNPNLTYTINTQLTQISQAPIPIPQSYSSPPPPIHSVPNSATLQLLNPWQIQAQNKLVEPIKTNKSSNPPDMDFRNQDGSYDWKSMTMYYKGLANLKNTLNVEFKNQDGSCD